MVRRAAAEGIKRLAIWISHACCAAQGPTRALGALPGHAWLCCFVSLCAGSPALAVLCVWARVSLKHSLPLLKTCFDISRLAAAPAALCVWNPSGGLTDKIWLSWKAVVPLGCNAHRAWGALSEGKAIGVAGGLRPSACSSLRGCMHRAAYGGFHHFHTVHAEHTARIQLAGCESNRLLCLSLSFQIPFRFSISSAQAHPHNQLLSGQLPRCDIYRVYWKLLAHCWASKCDCFSK